VPDLGFVQLGVCDVIFLPLASEDFYIRIGMDIATIGYPMGTDSLTALGKVNQITPFLRRGIISSIFPFPQTSVFVNLLPSSRRRSIKFERAFLRNDQVCRPLRISGRNTHAQKAARR
jgi:hypothetical protein